MEILVYPIKSDLHDKVKLDRYEIQYIEEINKELSKLTNNKIRLTVNDDVDAVKDKPFKLVLVLSGGSENKFLKIYTKLTEPFLILSYNKNNSLAASLEIAAYLRKNRNDVEVLHGNVSYITQRILERYEISVKSIHNVELDNLGVIGEPSDWLISSKVKYHNAKEKFGVNLININIYELIDAYHEYDIDETNISEYENIDFDKYEIKKALTLYHALKDLIKKYNLKGLTLRCFSLLDPLNTTACLALSKLNSEGIICGCEGDVPSLLAMLQVKKLLNQEAFMCNPSMLDVNTNTIVLAHCAVPLGMCSKFKFDTHFESNIGLGIKGDLNVEDVTIFRHNSHLNEMFITEGKIIKNLNENDLCRTQIVVSAPYLDKLLTNTLGNHLIVIYGHHKKQLKSFYLSKGMSII